ncbi:MAG TPA: hypothetical protein VK527_11985, partial [Candidatus Limnocylindrales bacterium]|nr:hypothetical protein [Candidatus Limnocylindrales bacterium]
MKTRPGLSLCTFALGALLLGATASQPSRAPLRAPRPVTELVRIRYWTAPDHTRLVFDLSGPP